MRSVAFAIAGLGLLASTSVFAADIAAAPAEPVVPAVTPYDWTGPYVGVHAGYGWGNEDGNRSILFAPAQKFSVDGFVGGAHAGYNYQINQLVLGAEGDIDYTDLKGSQRFNVGGASTGTLGLKSDWQGSARLRAGYAIDSLLLYATGGLAVGNAKLSIGPWDDSNTHLGWTVGAGAEYAITPNWIGRLEVRYTNFQKKTYDTPDGQAKTGWDQTTATAGVSYKF